MRWEDVGYTPSWGENQRKQEEKDDDKSNPPSIFNKVDFPLPEGPIIVINSPSSILKFILFSALTSTLPLRYIFFNETTLIICTTYVLLSHRFFYVAKYYAKSDLLFEPSTRISLCTHQAELYQHPKSLKFAHLQNNRLLFVHL